jgi:hypothetical protein
MIAPGNSGNSGNKENEKEGAKWKRAKWPILQQGVSGAPNADCGNSLVF